jgi:hypothetical protein
VRADVARLLVAAVAVAAVVILMLVTGWADDRSSPGTRGRVPITQTVSDDAP